MADESKDRPNASEVGEGAWGAGAAGSTSKFVYIITGTVLHETHTHTHTNRIGSVYVCLPEPPLKKLGGGCPRIGKLAEMVDKLPNLLLFTSVKTPHHQYWNDALTNTQVSDRNRSTMANKSSRNWLSTRTENKN